MRANEDIVVASGSEQRLFVLSVSDILKDIMSEAKEKNSALKNMKLYMLDVGDVSCLDMIGSIVTVVGDGMCVVDLSSSSSSSSS